MFSRGSRRKLPLVLRALALAVLAALTVTASAVAGGPTMLVGAVEPEAMKATEAQAAAQIGLARSAGVGDAIRLTVLW